VIIECLCRPDPNCPEDPPAPSAPACRLEITRTPRIRIGCARVTCTRRCRLQIVQQGWRWVIVCACA